MILSKPAVAPWGIELSFLRTTIASEFQTVGRLRKNADLADVRFFATYGYFDLTCIKTLDDLLSPSALTLDSDITESAAFRFVSPASNKSSGSFRRALDRWVAAVAVFLKIHPMHVENSPIATRWRFARQIAAEIPSAFVFCGFGSCELLVMLGGRDLAKLLRQVTSMREAGRRNPLNSLRRSLRKKSPLFVGTSTFPLVSYENVHRVSDYKRLAGKIEPAVSISCDPESEARILSNYIRKVRIMNVYGRHDLVITWPEPVPTAEFVQILSSMRKEWAITGCVPHTTSYLEISRCDSPAISHGKGKRAVGAQQAFPSLESDLRRETLRKIEPAGLRAAVTEVALRLNACSRDWKIGAHYADMLNTFEYVQQTATLLTKKGAAEHLRNSDRFELTRIVDLARRAILQRHAGLETRPELLAYAESPLLCDIRLLVAAASCIPYFIFDNLIPGQKAEQTWAGYVLFFGESPRWLRQNILALPASAIFDPIGEWWKITHEAAHAVFKILELEQRLGKRYEKIKRYVETHLNPTGVQATRMISEVFANWFDWNYIFRRDTDFYISTIWQSWLNQPAVFSNAPQYLTRTVAILIASDLQRVTDLRQRGRRKRYLLPDLSKKLAHVERIISKYPAGADFMRRIDNQRENAVYALAERLHSLVFWLEKSFEADCGLTGLKTRLCPRYHNLEAHASALGRGNIVMQKVPNPCELHLRLMRKQRNTTSDIATDAAYIFTLANLVAKRHTDSLDE
jgi:hypothetical protein